MTTEVNQNQNVQPPISSLLKQAAGDPRTTNILLAVLVLCITGYMPDGFESVCTA